jgi:hypothetical protein
VPADLTLEQLHHVLQLAMGWHNCHMHDFQIGQQTFGKPDPDEGFTGAPTTASESAARLSRVLGKAGAKAVYAYDFGDNWQHRITVEKVLAPEPGSAGTRVSGGFFRTLGVLPVLGRDFYAGEDLPAAPRTVILSYAVWQKRYR